MSLTKKVPWGKIAVGLLLLLVGFAVYKSVGSKKSEITYETTKVIKKTVETHVAATGAIESTTTVTVGSQVSGPVSQVLVDFNSKVKKGQVLARIDPSEFLARQAQAQANLQSATAGLSSQQAQLAGQEAAVRQAEVAIATAEVNLEQAKASVAAASAGVLNAEASLKSKKVEADNNLVQYKRSEDLVARELIALSDRDAARTTYLISTASVQTAEAAVQQARAQLAQTKAQYESVNTEIRATRAKLASAQASRDAAQAQVQAARASVAQAQAAVQQASVDVERTTISSPIDGVVIDRKVDAGQTVAAQFQAPELFTIARDLSEMQVKALVSEADIGRVHRDAKVTFGVDAYPGKKFEGRVVQVRSAPDSDKSSTSSSSSSVVVYGVLVTAANPEHLLKPGMTASVEILAEVIKDALLLPSNALRYVPKSTDEETPKVEASWEAGKGSKARKDKNKDEAAKEELEPGTRRGVVWVLKDGKPEKREIVTGVADGDNIVVVSGDLKVDEKVITEESGGEEKRSRFRLSF